MSDLICAACGAPMRPDEARPGSEGMIPDLRFHAKLQLCKDVVMPRYWERRAEWAKDGAPIGPEIGVQEGLRR